MISPSKGHMVSLLCDKKIYIIGFNGRNLIFGRYSSVVENGFTSDGLNDGYLRVEEYLIGEVYHRRVFFSTKW